MKLKQASLSKVTANLSLAKVQATKPDDWRGTRTERGYDNRWLRAAKHYLSHHPLCAYCQREGRTTLATLVDHIIPHQMDMRLFWDSENNWQPLCATCHSSTKAREERQYRIGGGMHRLGA